MRMGLVAGCALAVGLVACAQPGDSGAFDSGGGEATRVPSETPAAGETFEDPEGSYEIEVDPDWEAHHGEIVAEVEGWVVAPPQDGFAPNVNVLTQRAPGMDLSEYLDVSAEQGSAIISDFELVTSDVVQGTESELGLLEYTGTQNGLELHFLATVAVRDGTAVVATFTAPPDVFDALRSEIEPYLLTLRAT